LGIGIPRVFNRQLTTPAPFMPHRPKMSAASASTTTPWAMCSSRIRPQQFGQICHHAVEVQRTGADDLATAERQQLLGQIGGPTGGSRDFLERLGNLRRHITVSPQQTEMPDDGRQQII